MRERIPDKCAYLLDKLANAMCPEAIIGFDVGCTGNKNKFELCIKPLGDDLIYLSTRWNQITVPTVFNLFAAKHPDFLLKPIHFISVDDLCSKYDIDKDELASSVLKRIRTLFNATLEWQNSVSIASSNSSKAICTPKFKSFHEFLIWLDLSINEA